MRELGWVEGKTVAFDWLYADAKPDRLSPLVAELLRRKVDVIVAQGTTAIRAAQSATTTVPIVMAGGGDPVGARLVQSLARPGGNVTGVSLLGQELMEKHVELLKQVLPALSRLTQIQAAGNPANSFFAQQMGAAAKKVGVQLGSLRSAVRTISRPRLAASPRTRPSCWPIRCSSRIVTASPG
jgi:putative ABC transport system substrate-binding protein